MFLEEWLIFWNHYMEIPALSSLPDGSMAPHDQGIKIIATAPALLKRGIHHVDIAGIHRALTTDPRPGRSCQELKPRPSENSTSWRLPPENQLLLLSLNMFLELTSYATD